MSNTIDKSKKLVAASCLALFLSSSAFAHEAGDLILRVGAISVEPDESSSLISTTSTGPLAGTKVGVGNDAQLRKHSSTTSNSGPELLLWKLKVSDSALSWRRDKLHHLFRQVPLRPGTKRTWR